MPSPTATGSSADSVEGGTATVYLAEDLKHDRKVALKVLRPELAAVLGADRFVQEIKTTAQLQHPHILPLYDSGSTAAAHGGGMGFLYYVMPYIEGETLREKLDREQQLGIDEAVNIATEVAAALQYAHEQGVIHRDIKPENILLRNGRAIVADFGIALAVSAAAGGRMTETGLSLGTPHYMSPEQATADKHITNRSDIYSLGSVLYESLTGEPPHTGSSAQMIIMKIVTDVARPVRELRKSVPPHVAAAVASGPGEAAGGPFRQRESVCRSASQSRLHLARRECHERRRRASGFPAGRPARLDGRHPADRRAGHLGLDSPESNDVRRPLSDRHWARPVPSMESRSRSRRRSHPTERHWYSAIR